MVSLAKRKNDINTKWSEISIHCGADVGFLVHSASGRPYTFGSPSFETVAKRFLNGESSSSTSSLQRSILDSYEKTKIEELCKVYNNVLEKANVEENKGVAIAETLQVKEDAWWKLDVTKVNDEEEVKLLLKKHEELYKKLCAGTFKKKLRKR